MKIRAFALALAPIALAGLPLAAPLQAQEAAEAAQYTGEEAEYTDLYNAIDEVVDSDAMIDATLVVMARQFNADPNMKMLEAMSPGTIDEITQELRPLFVRQSERIRTQYRPQMQAVFAQYLTPEDAVVAADFYRSDLGRKLMSNVSNSYSPDATLSGISEDTEITVEQVQEDISNASSAAVSKMSREELAEAGRMAMQQPALLKLGAMGPALNAVRAKMENEPLSKEEEAELEALMLAVLSRRFPDLFQ
jgi:hypothetical protein